MHVIGIGLKYRRTTGTLRQDSQCKQRVVVVALVVGLVLFFSSDPGSIPKLLAKLAKIIINSRATMPEWMAERIPADSSDLKEMVLEFRANAAMLQVAGAQTGRGLL